ncbi:hypothetical protein BT67DRAFT_95641 [Trichocladium antarcticum]|uniref:Uncharacterized protein n=1 Tax=Trichocladium antarcticum TaxID=1450529 RepID=A0AAN6ZFE9_9PEZI|nr:hypothetical protein BT67DRAFT_95641 [Trichocladium antarcticum]
MMLPMYPPSPPEESKAQVTTGSAMLITEAANGPPPLGPWAPSAALRNTMSMGRRRATPGGRRFIRSSDLSNCSCRL